MRAIVIVRPAGPTSKGELELHHVPMPEPGPGQVRVRVHACAVNRADLLQVAGRYPAPPDAPADVPGLEIAGEVDAIGAGVTEFAAGDRVFGIVGGGAYAEATVVHARTLAAIPPGIDFVQAAAIPEAFVTAYDAIVLQAGLSAGEVLLVHAVGSGVGTAAVQIAKAIGARAIGTARTPDKLARARELGLVAGVVPEVADDRSMHFASKVRQAAGGRGVDVVLELVGGKYVPESLASLENQGRLVLVGLLAGARAEIDLGMVLGRRLRIFGTALRSRPIEEKMVAGQVLARHIAPLVASGAFAAVVDRTMPLEKAAEAHAYVATNEGFGKVVLTM
jgi:putative PIG3 family NAD(P)H quinone oxidoreductase